MHIFNINVSTRGNVKTDPRKYHVAAFSADDFLFTMNDRSQDDYSLHSIDIKGAPFSQKRINNKTIWVHDDNIKGNKNGSVDYKYTVKVKRLSDGAILTEDPVIVNE